MENIQLYLTLSTEFFFGALTTWNCKLQYLLSKWVPPNKRKERLIIANARKGIEIKNFLKATVSVATLQIILLISILT
jgi:hypothetical protein